MYRYGTIKLVVVGGKEGKEEFEDWLTPIVANIVWEANKCEEGEREKEGHKPITRENMMDPLFIVVL